MRPPLWIVVFAIICAFPPVARAQSQAEIDQGARDAYEMARGFSECVGYWAFWAEVEEALGNTASAENARGIGRGARLSAGYMLSMRHRLEQPQESPRTYGSWDSYIDSVASVTATRMMASLEQNDTGTIRGQATICTALGETAQEIVEQIRFETLSRQ